MMAADQPRPIPHALRIAGVAAWAAAGAPVLIAAAREPAVLSEPRVLGWLAAYAAFLAFLLLGSRAEAARPRGLGTRLLILLRTVLALAANALIPTPIGGISLGGVLLVVVAGGLALSFGLLASLAWVAAQSAALLVIYLFIANWPAGIGIVAAGAYLAFQLFALLVSAMAVSESAARRALTDANQRLHAAQAELGRAAAQAERARLWRELHDVMGHHLAALSLSLEAAANLTEGRARELTRHGRALARLMLADIRSVLGEDSEGQPPSDLAARLGAIGEGWPGLTVHRGIGPGSARLSAAQVHALLRAVQEFITNTARHGGPDARNVWIGVRAEGEAMVLDARDDGRGAPRVTEGTGLSHMRERFEGLGGGLEVTTSPGRGFAVRAVLPLGQGENGGDP